MEKVKLKLCELNGNAFSLLGAFAVAAREQGWGEREIDVVRQEAMAADYDHLLQTLTAHTAHPEE